MSQHVSFSSTLCLPKWFDSRTRFPSPTIPQCRERMRCPPVSVAASRMMTEIFLPVARHVLLFPLITVYSCSSCLLKLLSSPLTLFPSLHLSLLVLFMQQIPLCRERMGHFTPINTVHESTSLSTKQRHNRAVSRPTFHTALQITLNGKKG